eukprot:355896-Chlamydomonas_euryale.AAC.4
MGTDRMATWLRSAAACTGVSAAAAAMRALKWTRVPPAAPLMDDPTAAAAARDAILMAPSVRRTAHRSRTPSAPLATPAAPSASPTEPLLAAPCRALLAEWSRATGGSIRGERICASASEKRAPGGSSAAAAAAAASISAVAGSSGLPATTWSHRNASAAVDSCVSNTAMLAAPVEVPGGLPTFCVLRPPRQRPRLLAAAAIAAASAATYRQPRRHISRRYEHVCVGALERKRTHAAQRALAAANPAVVAFAAAPGCATAWGRRLRRRRAPLAPRRRWRGLTLRPPGAGRARHIQRHCHVRVERPQVTDRRGGPRCRERPPAGALVGTGRPAGRCRCCCCCRSFVAAPPLPRPARWGLPAACPSRASAALPRRTGPCARPPAPPASRPAARDRWARSGCCCGRPG